MESSPPTGRVYRMKGWWRMFACFFAMFGCFFLFTSLRDMLSGQKEPRSVDIVIPVILVIAGVIMAVHAFTSTLVFTCDAALLISSFRRRSLPFGAISGRREYVVRGRRGSTRYLKLESNDDRSEPLEFGKALYTFDAVFWSWFNSLPDLDAMDKARNEAQKAKRNDSNFGLV